MAIAHSKYDIELNGVLSKRQMQTPSYLSFESFLLFLPLSIVVMAERNEAVKILIVYLVLIDR